MRIGLAVVVYIVHIFSTTQMCCQALDLNMMADAFDDQYICCEDKMEEEMPTILAKERKYHEFDKMWKYATEHWSRDNKKLPSSFKDEYGVAVVLYTMESPIYKQLNGNISIAGKSRDYYMRNFHFKALHFYLTRALQELRKGCANRFTTYRGSSQKYTVSSEFRFGQFASSSLRKGIAEIFGTKTFFTISTCFGVDIADLSTFEEQEILIPIAEKFRNIKNDGNHYTVESMGELCSYFNCAYLGGEKRKEPVCHSDNSNNDGTNMKPGQAMKTSVCNSGIFLYSGSRVWLFFTGLSMSIMTSLRS